jgi:outer membrane lipoprotein SlyB
MKATIDQEWEKQMSKYMRAMALVFTLLSASAAADDFSLRSAVGGGLGGALGSFLGAELGGRNAAIVGSGLGAAVGAAVATGGYDRYDGRRYRYRDDYCPNGQWRNGRCTAYAD